MTYYDMSFEIFKATMLGSLSPSELALRQSNIDDIELDSNPIEARKEENEHRKAAHGMIDMALEAGKITPEEANRRKARWDVMHGY